MDKNVIRKQNLETVLGLLFQQKQLFANDLVKQSQLSMVTINSLLKELIEQGSVIAGPITAKSSGRPAIMYHFNYAYSHALLWSIQNKESNLIIKSKVVNLSGEIMSEDTLDFSEVTQANFLKLLKEKLETHPEIDRIGLLLPGKVYQGVVSSSWYNKFNGWELAKLVGTVTELPFFVQNDAHLITVGYCLKKGIPLAQTILGVFYPQKSSPGITIMVEGHFIEGASSLAGEGKYLPNLMGKQVPETDLAMAKNIVGFLPFYNAALAPNQIIIASDGVDEALIVREIQQEKLLKDQPNQPDIKFVSDFQAAITLGLRWLVYEETPFSL